MAAPTNHTKLLAWVEEIRALVQPDRVRWCDGSRQEWDELFALLVRENRCVKLKKRKNCYLFRSDPRDVARVEARTFICAATKEEAGPTNNWEDPTKMRNKLRGFFKGCMRGRTMYILPFSMGPIGSDISKIGVQITDSEYVVLNTQLMTRMGPRVLEVLGDDGFFVQCLHSVGCPLGPGQKDVPWPCVPEKTHICHFPDDYSIWSFGSGYGGNALLGKKCLALRIASMMARDQGWMAEHMLIMGATSPTGERTYVTGAFPSQCGKTNFAMILPPKGMEDWKISCVGDDIAWLKPHQDGYLHAINPENGFFGVCPGTSYDSNPTAMNSIKEDCIFTNVALTDDGDVWWEGISNQTPAHLVDWQGNHWTPGCGRKASHPNARFTAPLRNCPILDDKWDDPSGVPVKAFMFGGRRKLDVPLIFESFNWQHGVFIAATMGSETTSAAEGKAGRLRHDPFAMLPFCGYNMSHYIEHYLRMSKRIPNLPRIFHVNWFRKDAGKWLWPGFTQNMRVLKWIVDRCNGRGFAFQSPLGWIPRYNDLPWKGLHYSKDQWDSLMKFDCDRLRLNGISHDQLFLRLHSVPKEMIFEKQLLTSRL